MLDCPFNRQTDNTFFLNNLMIFARMILSRLAGFFQTSFLPWVTNIYFRFFVIFSCYRQCFPLQIKYIKFFQIGVEAERGCGVCGGGHVIF